MVLFGCSVAYVSMASKLRFISKLQEKYLRFVYCVFYFVIVVFVVISNNGFVFMFFFRALSKCKVLLGTQ
jgi:hypothetical protein